MNDFSEYLNYSDEADKAKQLKIMDKIILSKETEEKVKAVADYITESNNDEGAAKAIEKFVLKRGGESC